MGEDSEMNNKPVFWTCGLEEDEAISNAIKIELKLEYYNIPLYTHPTRKLKVKELTDEEINELYMECGNLRWGWQIEFARAILRKAQEK